ncbi:MAG: hypothetical protein RJA95_1100, partial [Verrucomicrobiota bacterium]
EINCSKAEPNAAPNAGEALEGKSEFDEPTAPTE